MSEQVLTLRQLNRTLLLRQLLLRRQRLSPLRAIERLAGLQAQFAPAPYIALRARLDGFERGSLEQALLRGRVVKALLMRATMHLVSARDLPLFDAAVREARTLTRARGTSPPPARIVERVAALARERPRTRAEIMSALGFDSRTTEVEEIRAYFWVVALARLEQTPECALYGFRGSPKFRPLEHDLPPRADAIAHLIGRYLGAFGPASRADLAYWSGVPLRQLDPVLETLRLRTLRYESGNVLLDLPRAPLAAGDEAAPPRLLAPFDEIVLAHKDRTRIIGDEHRSHVIRGADVASTFTVDGFVAGTWRRKDDRIALEPFGPLPRTARRELDDEARRLAAWLR